MGGRLLRSEGFPAAAATVPAALAKQAKRQSNTECLHTKMFVSVACTAASSGGTTLVASSSSCPSSQGGKLSHELIGPGCQQCSLGNLQARACLFAQSRGKQQFMSVHFL